ncbi:sensor histidine kinase [Xanthobacter sediminis]
MDVVHGDAVHRPDDAAPRRRVPFLAVQLLGWGLFAVVDLVNRELSYRAPAEALTLTLLAYVLLVAVSATLRWTYDRLCPDARLDVATVGKVAVLSAAAAAVVTAGIGGVRHSQGWSIPAWSTLEEVVLPFIHYYLALLAWGILYFWVRTERGRQHARDQAVAAQMETLHAEIRALRLQLDPHFLFNALNGLAEEVPEHPDAALAMIRDLTQYLRHLLAGIRIPVVTMASEAEGLSAYLRIQEARFGDKVHARLHLDPAAAGRPIANLLLQPLVENAFEHGDRAARLDVDIRVGVDGDALTVEIENTGHLAAAGTGRAHHGIGLENVRRRLDLHYPGRHTFALQQARGSDGAPGGTHVVAVLRLEGEPCSVS